MGGVGAGKSHIGAYDLLRRVLPGRLYMTLAPTYPMLRDATFRTFRRIAEDLDLWGGYQRTEFIATVRTRYGGTAEVLFRSGDDPDRLRGPNLSGVWMDEASLLKREAFEQALARLREAGERGWLSATFTPKGRQHWTYEIFGKGAADVELVHARTLDNPFVAPEYLTTLEGKYGSLRALQELEGQFVDVEGAEWPPDYFGPGIWFDDWPPLNLRVIALDPSKGTDAKHGDYSAFVLLGRDRDGGLWCDADLAKKRPTSLIVAQGLELQRQFHADGMVIETNQFQEMLADDFDRQATEQGVIVPVFRIDNRVNKEVRIRRLGPYLARGAIRFKADSPGAELLVQQLREFPEGDHDDAPDALEMALRLMGQLLAGTEADEEATVLRF